MDMSSMPSSTMSMAMPSSTSSSMADSSMSGMDMSGMSMSDMTMSMSRMMMVFFNSESTPLYSSAWKPSTSGQYAGTLVFLILLSIVFRGLCSAKCQLEALWARRHSHRKIIVVAPISGTATPDVDEDSKTPRVGILNVNGKEERVRLLPDSASTPGATYGGIMPWRLSVDLPRAAFVTVMVGVAYLLMLAVMTMNIGYFIAVLGGSFIGELVFGRYGAMHSGGQVH